MIDGMNNPDERAAPEYQVYDATGRLVFSSSQPPARKRRAIHPYVTYAVLLLCVGNFILFNLVLESVPSDLLFNPAGGAIFPGLLTHMFLHVGFGHLFGNAMLLFFFGSIVERSYGPVRYVLLFLISGVIAALAQSLLQPGWLLGASGALSGVIAAFVRHYPRVRFFLFLLPVPAWLAAVLWLAYNIWGASQTDDVGVAFVAHIVGFVTGFVTSLLMFPPHTSKTT